MMDDQELERVARALVLAHGDASSLLRRLLAMPPRFREDGEVQAVIAALQVWLCIAPVPC